MSEELVYNSGRPRRTRSSYSSITPVTSKSNPYKKPTYSVGRNSDTPDDSPDDEGSDTTTPSSSRRGARRRKPGRPFGSTTKNRSTPVNTPTNSSGRGNRGGGRGRRGSRGGSSITTPISYTMDTTPVPSPRKRGGGRLSWSSKTRPECVAHRNDRRVSSGGTRKRKRRGGYSTADYHYGSDFESDEMESDPEESVQSEQDSDQAETPEPLDEQLESDSDVSIGSARLVGLPSIPVPFWLDPDVEPPELEIPSSSDDLLLSRDLLIDAIAIYEPLRRFSYLLRLSPFRFEDFCAALAAEETSVLLAEIHIQLLKALLREDDAVNTTFGANESKDSVQSVLFFIDYMTWAECLRTYIESDPLWSDALALLTSVEYPFCGADIRIKILTWLLDTFIVSNSVRDSLTSDGNIVHEDHCRSCNRLGELICCESCPAVYHLECIHLPTGTKEPPDEWKCPICVHHEIPGVMDCISEIEKAGVLSRHERLGYDRHGRKYWFLVRRIIVEGEEKSQVWYYSTRLQVEELLYRLDGTNYEKELVENISNLKEEIFRQMTVTETVTNKMNVQHRKTYLEAENGFLMRIHEEREIIKKQEAEEKHRIEEEALKAKQEELEHRRRLQDHEKHKVEEEKKRTRQERIEKRNKVKLRQSLGKIVDLDESLEQFLLNEESKDSIAESDDGTIKKEKGDSSKDVAENGGIDFNEAETQKITAEEEDLPPTITKEVKDENDDEVEEDTKMPELKLEVDDTPTPESDDSKHEPTTEPVIKVEPEDIEKLVQTSILPKIAEKSKSLDLEVDSEERITRLRSTGLYKLGQEGGFKTYVNRFSADPLALSKTQHTEERDKKRIMSHKFSLTQASECKWSGYQQGLRLTILTTVRQTLLNMEANIPSTLMHCNWILLRKSWINAVTVCETAEEFSKALMMFASCLRPSVFNPVWLEGVGHVKLIRTSAIEKDIRKRNEKAEKKFRDDEEDRLKLLPQFVKYTIPPKHQVWKQKGEEFRTHGIYGWIWLSNFRPAKPKDSRKMGLLRGPHKHVIQVKSSTGKIKTMLIDPDTYDNLMAKRATTDIKKDDASSTTITTHETSSDFTIENDVQFVMESLLADIVAGRTTSSLSEVQKTSAVEKDSTSKPEGTVISTAAPTEISDKKTEVTQSGRKFVRSDVINVSLGIVSANRILYPKIAHPVPSLDSLLERRLKLKEMEDKELLEQYGAEVLESLKGPQPVLETAPIVVPVDSNFPFGGAYAVTCYSFECRKAERDGISDFDRRCYSPMCRLKYVVRETRRRKYERERAINFDKMMKQRNEIMQKRKYNQISTSEKVSLDLLPEQKKDGGSVKYPLWSKFRYNSSKQHSILVLPNHELRKLGRSGGRVWSPVGFTPNHRPNSWGWPYPCGRPLFKTAWQYRTVHSSGIHAVALQLRILFAGVRWDDILMKPLNPDGKSQITTDMEVITSEILDHRIVGRFLETFQYLRKRHIVPIDAPKTIREVVPSRSGLRKRKLAEIPDNSNPVVREEWVNEDQFDIWEIRLYGEKLERKNEKKPEPPSGSTRSKTGVSIKMPEKYDPSPKEKEQSIPSTVPTRAHSAVSQSVSEIDDDIKIKTHVSKRDNHAKIAHNPNKAPTLTASRQLLQQQATNQPGLSPTTKAIAITQGTTPSGKKFFVTKQVPVTATGPTNSPQTPGTTKELPKTGILKKAITNNGQNTAATALINSTVATTSTSSVSQPTYNIERSADGKIEVRGLQPGQTAVATSDGKIIVYQKPSGTNDASPGSNVQIIQTPVSASAPPQPLINISNPAIRTVLAASNSAQTSSLATTPTRQIEVKRKAPAVTVKQPIIYNINRTAEDLKQAPVRLQTPNGLVEARYEHVVKSATGQDQIILGPGLPIIQLLPSLTPTSTPSSTATTTGTTQSISEPPPLQQIQPTVVSSALIQQPVASVLASSLPLQASNAGVVKTEIGNIGTIPSSNISGQEVQATSTTASSINQPQLGEITPGTRILFNDGTKTYAINTTGFTSAQMKQIMEQLSQRKASVQENTTSSTASGVTLAVSSPQQIIQQPISLGQSLIQTPQGLVLQQQPRFVIQSQEQGRALVLQTQPQVGGFQQIATIGGQKVLLNRMPTGTPIIRTLGAVSMGQVASSTQSQLPVLQKLIQVQVPATSLAVSTGVLQGTMPNSVVTTTPTTSIVTSSPQLRPITLNEVGPMTQQQISRTSLPISIVSPSKARQPVSTASPRLNLSSPQSNLTPTPAISQHSLTPSAPLTTSNTTAPPLQLATVRIQSPIQSSPSSLQIRPQPALTTIASTVAGSQTRGGISSSTPNRIPSILRGSIGSSVNVPSPVPTLASSPVSVPGTPQLTQSIDSTTAAKRLTASIQHRSNGAWIIIGGLPSNLTDFQSNLLENQISRRLLGTGYKLGYSITSSLITGSSCEIPLVRAEASPSVTTNVTEPESMVQILQKTSPAASTELVFARKSLPPPILESKTSPSTFQTPVSSITAVKSSPPPLTPLTSSADAVLAFNDQKQELKSAVAVGVKRTATALVLEEAKGLPSAKISKMKSSPPLQSVQSNIDSEARFLMSQDVIPQHEIPETIVSQAEITTDDLKSTLSSATPTFNSMVKLEENIGLSDATLSRLTSTQTLTPGLVSRSVVQKPVKSRRKSPLRSDRTEKSPVKSNAVNHHKLVANLYKHKEHLKKDIFKKRALLEKELHMEIQAEVTELKRRQEQAPDGNALSKLSLNSKETVKKKSPGTLPGNKAGTRGRAGVFGSRKSRGRKSKHVEDDLYCICKTPYDPSRFYITCEKCSNSYHIECSGISKEIFENSSSFEFTCENCRNEQTPELFCLCRQPYDETQFYIACDKCDDWLHGKCVGVLPIEGSKIDQYVCPRCDPETPMNYANLKPLRNEDYVQLDALLKLVIAHKSSKPFREPVDIKLAPNYFRVIKEPMDLQTIELRVEQKVYSKLQEFISDIMKIFVNCRCFNQADSPFTKSANVLEAFLAQKMKIIREKFGKSI